MSSSRYLILVSPLSPPRGRYKPNLLLLAEFHSQTAIEAAKRINAKLRKMGKTAEDIESVTNRTHEACIRIIDKQFKPMDNFADRDHCVQVCLGL